jgi:6,7-dimethyl-8-ribityllumazine synthase
MPQQFIPDLDGRDLTVGVVAARFNAPVCDALLAAALAELARLGVPDDEVLVARVPGALEVPVAAATMADAGGVDAVVALGAVIRGETYHFEVVSDQSAAGLMQVQVESAIPVANGILTCDTDAQAEARMHVKGAEAARVAVEMANLLRAIADESR